MPTLAIIVILIFLGWTLTVSPTLTLVLFCVFGLPFVLLWAFVLNFKFGLAVLSVLILAGLLTVPWLTLPIVGLSIVILGVASV